jgi:hypothetical protein
MPSTGLCRVVPDCLRGKGSAHAASAQSESLKEVEQRVGWPVSTGCGFEWCGACECAFLQGEIGMQVDLDSVCLLVSELERDDRGVHAGVQQAHGGRVTQHMWRDRLCTDRGA